MDVNEIFNLVIAALGGGGITSLVNWRLHRRKETAAVKQDEIEVIRKTIDEVYKPTIETLNSQVTELREEVTKLRTDVKRLRAERDECHEAMSELRSQVEGLAAGRPQRDHKTGRFSKCAPKEEEVISDGDDK